MKETFQDCQKVCHIIKTLYTKNIERKSISISECEFLY